MFSELKPRVDRVTMSDFEDDSGNVDWGAYRAAEVENGQTCSVCGAGILWPSGRRDKCGSCKVADGDGEVDHERLIRCPSCGKMWDPYESEDYECLHDGDHDVWCGFCDHKFRVQTAVSYTFTSPARVPADRHPALPKGDGE